MRAYQVLMTLEVFLAGGFAALMLVRNLLLTIMARLVTFSAQAEIYNVLDHLLPYYLGYLAAMLVVGMLAVAAWAWQWVQRRASPALDVA